jgi:hypothetical protein
MNWSFQLRSKLARAIQKKSVEIEKNVWQDRVFMDSYDERVAEAHRRILNNFCPLGFESSNFCETKIESNEEVMMFVSVGEYLFFHTTQGQILKINQEVAEKFLVFSI